MSWARTQLGELSEAIDYGVTASANFSDGDAKFLRITDIQDNKVDWATVPYCAAPAKKLANAMLRDGDIVFARTGATTGKSFLLKKPPSHAVFASYLIRVRPSEDIHPAYLAHFFDTPDYWRQIKAKAQGAAQEGVNASKLASLEIPFPPLYEQRRVAAILDKADQLRQKRRQAIALLESLTQSIFLEMFGDLAASTDRWPRLPLSEVAEIGSGITKGRKTNTTSTIEVPYLAVANVQDKALNLATVKTIEATPSEIEKYKLEANDLLLTEGGDPDKLGRGTLWRGELPLAIHQNHIFRVRFTSAQIDPLYANWVIGSEYGKRYFLKSAKQTTGIASINKSQLSSFPMILPPVNLQRSFVKRAEAVSSQIRSHTAHLDSFNSAFSALQTSAFRGGI
ncbi:restriction endonuclease subunit S [Rhizobium sp. 969_B3_N1_2]|uniref:restriction endonuclease subunit S n=1 Tax=Rhizobium sp. 969_B3_N1_2 TaxID=3276278 RepID=UPI003F20921E